MTIRFLWLCLVVVSCAAAAAQTNDAVVFDDGFERGATAAWPVAGEATSARCVTTEPHSGRWCLRVVDDGDQGGQANTRYLPAPRPGVYYVEAWLRADPKHADTIKFDVQFFRRDQYYYGATIVGVTSSTKWTRLAAFVLVPEYAELVRLRVQPAWGDRKRRGACFVDDVYMASLDRALRDGRMHLKHERKPCLNTDPDGRVGSPPPDMRRKPPFPSQFGFEDLTGWTMESFGDIEGVFCRSREEQLRGRYVGKLRYKTRGRAFVVLRPPKPIPIPGRYDAVQIWAFNDRRIKPRGEAAHITVVVRDGGRIRPIALPRMCWSFWSIAHLRLDEPVGPGAELVELRLEDLQAKYPRTLCLDELAFHNEPTEPLALPLPPMPKPTLPRGVLPTPAQAGTNRVERRGDAFVFTWTAGGRSVRYRYAPRSGALDDLSVEADGLRFAPAAGGGPTLVWGEKKYDAGVPPMRARLLRAQADARSVLAVWRYEVGDHSAVVTWRLRIDGPSLVLTVDEPKGLIACWRYGKPAAHAVEPIHAPYLTGHCGGAPVWLVERRAFVHVQPDWYVTNASAVTSGGCYYTPAFRGRRPPLHERVAITVSTDFHEVLPNIPNPKSPYARVLGEYVYTNIHGSLDGDALERCLALWRWMKAMGMEKIIVKHHAHTWSDHSGQGNEPFVLRVRAARNISGRDAALAAYVRDVKALGFQYFFYTDYCLLGPVCAQWDEGLVSLTPKGQWKWGWYQYFGLTPIMGARFAEQIAPQIAAKFGNTGSYCDQHTSGPPSRDVDYDPRKPGAAMQRTVYRCYCRVLQAEKQAYRGPVVSEGGDYWIYAGIVDGNYAQLRTPRGVKRWQLPFLVDFDLLKIHPLEVDLGVGWRASYGYEKYAKNYDDAVDRFLCATIAFGHAGILYGPGFPGVYNLKDKNDPLGKWKRSVVRTYFMTQQLASRYALVPVRRIAYWDGRRLLAPSDALRTGAYKRSQVFVEYANGLRVFANGSFKESWRVRGPQSEVVLPPNGWLAWQGDEFLEYSALRNGRRVDYCRSPVYTFADGRGVETDFGDVKATNAVIVLHRRGGKRIEVNSPMWR